MGIIGAVKVVVVAILVVVGVVVVVVCIFLGRDGTSLTEFAILSPEMLSHVCSQSPLDVNYHMVPIDNNGRPSCAGALT